MGLPLHYFSSSAIGHESTQGSSGSLSSNYDAAGSEPVYDASAQQHHQQQEDLNLRQVGSWVTATHDMAFAGMEQNTSESYDTLNDTTPFYNNAGQPSSHPGHRHYHHTQQHGYHSVPTAGSWDGRSGPVSYPAQTMATNGSFAAFDPSQDMADVHDRAMQNDLVHQRLESYLAEPWEEGNRSVALPYESRSSRSSQRAHDGAHNLLEGHNGAAMLTKSQVSGP
ncbi:hypothetical protein M406DRAFT_73447 [Cryphonectria parasitica EP155]|uniref:Uncharacterized protein n=1 Tax=Cryphonectria parasitica (strain ATCC 38755 / EP155) TaxID=660469 RepID=A0A9P4XU07_CRYP1|nr:uncharacterized protein M406DRAFT_73447 [Cryphonectria parasitica EP155]KAF3760994.1 hypothetical protein M406DRAFT_73447 [Cryphonectria parasitica EP155]